MKTSGPYWAVVSDVGRKEGDHFNKDAGVEFLEAINRDFPDRSWPVFISTTPKTARARRAELEALGAALVTGSPSALLTELYKLQAGVN